MLNHLDPNITVAIAEQCNLSLYKGVIFNFWFVCQKHIPYLQQMILANVLHIQTLLY